MVKHFYLFVFFISSHLLTAQSWYDVNTPLGTSEYFTVIKWVDKENFWATNNEFNVFYSEDAGNSYIKKPTGGNLITDLEAINKDSVFVLRNYRPELYFSGDKGNTFTKYELIENGDTAFRNGLAAKIIIFDNLHYSVFGEDSVGGCPEVWNTGNGGKSWSRLDCNQINIANSKFSNINFYPLFETFGSNALLKFYDVENTFFKVSNFGNKWEKISIPKELKLSNSMAFSDSMNGICYRNVTTNNNLARTIDGGYTWDTIYGLPVNCNKVEWANGSSKQGFYIAYGVSGSFISFTNGEKWEKVDSEIHGNISFFNSEVGISSFPKDANGNGNRLWNGFISSVENTINQTISVYPNPFTSEIKVIIDEITFFEIYDMTGSKIKNGKIIPQNDNKILLDDLTSGMYFIVMNNEKGNQKIKIIKN